jgi:hypothetical protein
MSETLGEITFKVKVVIEHDGGGFEESPYSYLSFESAEVVSHTIPEQNIEWLLMEASEGDVLSDANLVGAIQELATPVIVKLDELRLF